jgi:hypothetical protein
MKLLNSKITTIILAILCSTLLITTLIYAESASKLKTQLAEQETRYIEWYNNVKQTSFDYNTELVKSLTSQIAVMEQEQDTGYNQYEVAIEYYREAYNVMVEDRNRLVAELAKRRVTFYPVEEIVYRDRVIKEFENKTQLCEWARDTITYLMPSGAYEVDCDDYASRLQRKALQQGYIMSVQLVEDGQIYGVDVSHIADKYHMGNLAMIGQNIYYVEPVPSDNATDNLIVVRVGSRD